MTGGRSGGPDFGGDLASLPVLELLQVLSFTRRNGRIVLVGPDGEPASCDLAQGRVVAARCHHLEGYEAVLELTTWEEGRFEFRHSSVLVETAGDHCEINAITFEAARLADELERRLDHLPEETNRLRVRESASLPEDALEISLQEVWKALWREPGLDLQRLRARVGLCSQKVELGVAVLLSEGCLELEEPMPRPAFPRPVATEPALDESAPAAKTRLRERYPRGLRILVVLSPQHSPAQLAAALSRLCGLFGTPSLTPQAFATAPSFARFRPRGGGSVSLTFLPVQKQNRFLFDGFSSSVDFIFVPLDAGDEGAAWQAHLPVGASFETADTSARILEELHDHAARLIEGSF